jgi:MoxR-like ATPase
LLSDFQITIPEMGTVRATQRPLVILTSNRVRELSEALRRRCLYLWIGYPDVERETEILRLKVPGASAALTGQIARFLQALRKVGLVKAPGVAEALDWAAALVALHRDALDEEAVRETLGVIVKQQDDLQRLRGKEMLALLKQV